MLTKNVHREYVRLRAAGWVASAALRAARVVDAFSDAEDAGQVRFRVEPDECSTAEDAAYCEGYTAREQAAAQARAERQGVWGIVAEVRVPPCSCCGAAERWDVVDSVWGFVGDDWRDSGYDTDLRDAALDALRAQSEHAAAEGRVHS